jgi:alkanesulfonate monooxygenase
MPPERADGNTLDDKDERYARTSESRYRVPEWTSETVRLPKIRHVEGFFAGEAVSPGRHPHLRWRRPDAAIEVAAKHADTLRCGRILRTGAMSPGARSCH